MANAAYTFYLESYKAAVQDMIREDYPDSLLDHAATLKIHLEINNFLQFILHEQYIGENYELEMLKGLAEDDPFYKATLEAIEHVNSVTNHPIIGLHPLNLNGMLIAILEVK